MWDAGGVICWHLPYVYIHTMYNHLWKLFKHVSLFLHFYEMSKMCRTKRWSQNFSIYFQTQQTCDGTLQWLSEINSAASHQLKLDVRWVDAAEHGNMLGGQLWREHTSPDSCHSSHAANTPHAPAGRGHLLQHGAWHLESDTQWQAGTPVTTETRCCCSH